MISEQAFRDLAASVDRSQSWGLNDSRGALNFLNPDTVLAALREATKGEVVPCADPDLTSRTRIETRDDRGESWLAVNERLTFEQHGAESMTHFDSLGHFFYDGRGHAGHGPNILTATGVSALDVQAAAGGIVSRGVLVDLPAVAEIPFLELGTFVSRSQILRWLETTGTETRPGDILFLRMGRPLAPWPPGGFPEVGGLDLDCAQWMYNEQFSLVITDCGLDSPAPVVEDVITPWHVLALTRMGLSLVDFADLEKLALRCRQADKYTFLAIVAVLPLSGATASPVNPIAVL